MVNEGVPFMKLSRFAAIAAVLACALAISACANTVRGVGRDVNATADAAEDSIN
jgi:predicted small secreted protein